MVPFWTSVVDEAILAQGDYLPGCRVPVFPLDFDTVQRTTAELDKADLIIVTQSCDRPSRVDPATIVGETACLPAGVVAASL
jgi:hypothetical protein